MINVAEEMSQSQIWPVLDSLRSELPTRDMPLALAALIYLRWADFQEAELEAIAAFDEADHEPVLPTGLHWRTWHELPPQQLQGFFGKQLSPALERLNNSRHNKLATHLHHIAPAVGKLKSLSPRSLHALIHWLAEQPFETPTDRRAMLDVFDAVLEKMRDKYAGEFRTPGAVARLMVELAAPVEGDRVYDPCFGSAGLLTAAYHYTLKTGKDRFSRSGAPPISISGVELSQDAYVIGLTRLALAGIEEPQLELGNSLERTSSDNPQRDGFDVVLANPPWGMRVPQVRMKHYPVPMRDATGIFIQHALAQLRPDGRAVIIVPQGILFRRGPERHLRRMLIKHHTVEAIVSLPETVFLPYTAVRSSVIILRRGGSTDRIRMVDAEPLFEEGKGRQPAVIRSDFSEQIEPCLHNSQPSENCWDVTAEDLARVDWDFTPRRRDQSGLAAILDSLRSQIDVLPLKDCCQILIGRNFRKEELLDAPPTSLKPPKQGAMFPEDKRGTEQKTLFDAPNIPYVRIKDINRGGANKGSSWLAPNVGPSIKSKWKMRAGDVLLSKSGTIGKVGIVRNGAVGAVAASGLFVLRPEQTLLDPHFLIAFINSSECRLWINDHAHAGTTIRHLSKSILETLPVPIPPIQIQHRVAAHYRDNNEDALMFLSQLVSGGEGDPVSERLNQVVDLLLDDADTINNPLDLNHLNSVIKIIQSHLENLILGDVTESVTGSFLVEWLVKLNKPLSGLSGIQNIPIGPGLLSVLQDSKRGVQEAGQVIKGNLPNASRAKNITTILSSWLEKACSAILTDVKLVFIADPETIVAGQFIELSLSVKNQSPLPLRDLKLKTVPNWGHGKIIYLAENTTETIHLSGVSPKSTGIFSIKVNWAGVALDGQHVEGEREIAFNIAESAANEGVDVPGLGGSPYVCGDPVRRERNDVFFGREELLEQIRRQVIQTGNVVLLEGNRRAGKSSILWHLEGPNAVPGWLGFYCSLQGAEGSKEGAGVPTVEVFREIAKSIAKGIQSLGGETPLPNGDVLASGKKLGIAKACREGIGMESSFSDFRDYAEIVLEKLEEHDLGLLLMLDEFDKLQEGIDSGVTSPQVPENIRYLVQSYPRFSAILTGSRRLKRLREEYWSALFGIGTRFGVTSLPPKAAHRLITEPVKNRLTYAREAVKRAIFMTAGQPYLLQCLCNRIFDMAAQLKTRSVTLDLVSKSGDALVEDNEHFASLWGYAGSNRRRLILTLCHKEASGPDPLQLGVIQEHLLAHGIEVDDETLIADLEFLRELELIELIGNVSGGHYTLAIPLMGIWIDKQQDFAAVLSKARLETEDQHE